MLKNPESSPKQNLNLPATSFEHLYCTRYYKQSRDELKYMTGCAKVIYKYFAILYKGVEDQ